MIIRLDAKDIKELLNQQYQAILEELEVEDDHPVSELLRDHFTELHAKIQFKSEEVGDEYKIPESVRETEEAIQRAREEAVEDFKRQLAEHAEQIKSRREAGEVSAGGASGPSDQSDEADTDESPAGPMQLSAKEAQKVIFGTKRSPYGKELQ